MYKLNQTIVIEFNKENRETIRNQKVENITADEEGYCYGEWKGKFVATWGLLCNEWHLI